MGWSGGTDVVSDLVRVLKKEIAEADKRKRIYQVLVGSLQSLDWDVEYEVQGEDEPLDELLDELGLLSGED